MFPSVRKRVYTQQKSQSKIKKSRSILIQSKRKQSSIKACIPYIEELKLSSINCNPQQYSIHQKRKKFHTQINSINMVSEFKIPYIPLEIDRDQNDSTLPSQTQIKTKFSKNAVQLRLQSLLKQFQKLNQRNEQDNRTVPIKNTHSTKKYNQCMAQFQKLPKKKVMWTEECIQEFLKTIVNINPFFKKLKAMVSLCLLKIGHIKVFEQNQVIHRQNDQLGMIGIMLWGEVLMKVSHNKMRIYLFAGDSLNQQLIFPNINELSRQYLSPKGGHNSARQSAKTKTPTGILYLKVNEYKMIFQQLIKIGQKNSILLAENMMKWSFAKKKNTRKEFSHL